MGGGGGDGEKVESIMDVGERILAVLGARIWRALSFVVLKKTNGISRAMDELSRVF